MEFVNVNFSDLPIPSLSYLREDRQNVRLIFAVIKLKFTQKTYRFILYSQDVGDISLEWLLKRLISPKMLRLRFFYFLVKIFLSLFFV